MRNLFSDLKLLKADGTIQFRDFVLELLGKDSQLIGGDTKLFGKILADEVIQQTHGFTFYSDIYMTVLRKNGTAVLMDFRWYVLNQEAFNKIVRILERIKSSTNSSMVVKSKKKGK